ncbi:hypothetical protein [Terrisporobacter mayombei]|nr:hypothetical protein [Terrisporobacter mayombei]
MVLVSLNENLDITGGDLAILLSGFFAAIILWPHQFTVKTKIL